MLVLEPLVQRASSFLEDEMDAGHMRRHEPRLLLLAIYSTVVGMITEVEVLRALGEEPTAPLPGAAPPGDPAVAALGASRRRGTRAGSEAQDGGAGGRGRVGRGGV